MFKKFWMLAVCLLLLGLGLALGPGLALAGPPTPGQQVAELEDFWQEMYGPQVGPQLVDEFIGTLGPAAAGQGPARRVLRRYRAALPAGTAL